jgi:hypothetical protein
MSLHRYGGADLSNDYLRGGAGLAVTAVPLLLFPMHWAVAVAFAAAAVLFLAFLVRTWMRQATTYEVDDRGIAAKGPLGGALAWPDLRRFKLRYFSTRRDRQKGWMQLDIQGAGRRLRLESSLSGFDQVVERAHEAAVANRVPLDESTDANLMSLGVVAPRSGLAERWGVRDPGTAER